jgi:hypothetical protein
MTSEAGRGIVSSEFTFELIEGNFNLRDMQQKYQHSY